MKSRGLPLVFCSRRSCRNRHLPGRKNCQQLAGGLLAVRCYELLQHYQRLYHRVCVMSGKNIGFLTAAAAPLQECVLGPPEAPEEAQIGSASKCSKSSTAKPHLHHRNRHLPGRKNCQQLAGGLLGRALL